MDNQQGPTVLSFMWQPGWGGVWGRMDPHICMAESLRCSPKTIRTLLIGQYKIKNKLKTIYMCVCN